MKKLLMVVFVLFIALALGSISYAQTAWPDRSGKKVEAPAKAPAPKAEPVPTFRLGLDNLSGDIGIIFKGTDGGAAIMYGVGLDIVTYKEGLATLRAQSFFESPDLLGDENATVAGMSLMVNLIKLIGLVPETNWLANAINPSLGLFGGYDFVSGKPAYGPMLSIINVQF